MPGKRTTHHWNLVRKLWTFGRPQWGPSDHQVPRAARQSLALQRAWEGDDPWRANLPASRVATPWHAVEPRPRSRWSPALAVPVAEQASSDFDWRIFRLVLHCRFSAIAVSLPRVDRVMKTAGFSPARDPSREMLGKAHHDEDLQDCRHTRRRDRPGSG